MKTATLILGLLIAALVAKQLWAQTTGDSAVPIDVAVPLSPVAVRAGGAWHLFYELHLTNFRRQDIELTLLETHAGPTDGPLVATYTEQGLSDLLVRPALPPNDTADKRVIGAGLRAVVMLNLVVKDKVLPTTLWHRLLFRMTETDNQQELVIGPIRISPDKPVKLAPPLRMGEWLAANGPSDSSDHRRALIAVNGKARIAQRFAIDWVKFGADGRLWHDEESRNENWYGYGAEIIKKPDGPLGHPSGPYFLARCCFVWRAVGGSRSLAVNRFGMTTRAKKACWETPAGLLVFVFALLFYVGRPLPLVSTPHGSRKMESAKKTAVQATGTPRLP